MFGDNEHYRALRKLGERDGPKSRPWVAALAALLDNRDKKGRRVVVGGFTKEDKDQSVALIIESMVKKYKCDEPVVVEYFRKYTPVLEILRNGTWAAYTSGQVLRAFYSFLAGGLTFIAVPPVSDIWKKIGATEYEKLKTEALKAFPLAVKKKKNAKTGEKGTKKRKKVDDDDDDDDDDEDHAGEADDDAAPAPAAAPAGDSGEEADDFEEGDEDEDGDGGDRFATIRSHTDMCSRVIKAPNC